MPTRVTKSVKPWIGTLLVAIFVAVLGIGIGIGFLIGHPVYLGFIALPLALLASLFVFSRIALAASYASVEGQIGAGASVLMAIRKGWTTTPAVAVNKNQDMVHQKCWPCRNCSYRRRLNRNASISSICSKRC
jgi:hypothetical protein